MRPIEFPPSLFVTARAPERQVKIGRLKLAEESPKLGYRGHSICSAEANQIFVGGPDHGLVKISQCQAKVWMRLGAERKDRVQIRRALR